MLFLVLKCRPHVFFGNLRAQVGHRALASYTADFLADTELSLLPLAAH